MSIVIWSSWNFNQDMYNVEQEKKSELLFPTALNIHILEFPSDSMYNSV